MTCKSSLPFADDQGDMPCTMHCELEEGHEGRHVEIGKLSGQHYTITWTGGMPISCTRCGVEKHPSDLIAEQGETLCIDCCWMAEHDKE